MPNSNCTGFYDLLHGWWGLVISFVLGLGGGIGRWLFAPLPDVADDVPVHVYRGERVDAR